MKMRRAMTALLAVLALITTRTWAMEYDIQTVAGDGVAGMNTAVPWDQAQFDGPSGIAIDAVQNFYVADTNNHRIVLMPLWSDVSTLAGDGTPGFTGDGGDPTLAQLSSPYGVCYAGTTLYISDQGNNRIRAVYGGVINTLAGTGAAGNNGDGAGLSTELSAPSGLAVGGGILYFMDTGNNLIRQVGGTGNVFTKVGDGTADYQEGLGTAAKLKGPTGIAYVTGDKLYFADTGNNRIRYMVTNTDTSLVAGNGTTGTAVDNPDPTSVPMNAPNGLALDGNGDLYIADTGNHVIRRIDSDTGAIVTVAGNGTPGFSGDGGAATQAQLNSPEGIAIDADGFIYITDRANNRIRRLTPRLSIRVTREMVPPNPVPGDPIVYRIIVENIGCATINQLYVIDTIPSVIENQASEQSLPAPTVTSEEGTGTRYVWTGNEISFLPGETYTFTITGALSQPCTAVSLSGTTFVMAQLMPAAVISTTMMFSNQTGGPLNPPLAQLAVTMIQNPGNGATLNRNNTLDYLIVVTNTGLATVNNVAVLDTVLPELYVTTTDQGGGYTVPSVFAAPSGSLFVWYSPSILAPGMEYTFTISGYLELVCGTDVNLANEAMVTAEVTGCPGAEFTTISNPGAATGRAVPATALALSVDVSHTPAGPPGLNTAMIYKVIVANVGAAQVNWLEVWNILPSAVVSSGQSESSGSLTWGGETSGSISWHGSISLNPGDSVTFYVNGTTDECTLGDVTDSAQAKGYYDCATVTTGWENDSFIHSGNGVYLSVTVTASNPNPKPGDFVEHRIVVTNRSLVALDNLTITSNLFGMPAAFDGYSWTVSGATLAYSLEGQHTWTGAVTVAPGDSVTLYEGLTMPCQIGNLSNLVGAESNSALCGTGSAGFEYIHNMDPALTGSIAVPASVKVGDTFTAVLNLTNTGGITADSVSATLYAATGAVAKIGGPAPAGLLTIPGSGTQAITWTFSVYGAGVILLSADSSGFDSCGQSVPISWIGTLNVGVLAPKLVSALAVERPVLGKAFNVILNVKNEGAVDAVSVVPVVKVEPGTGLVYPVSGPSPATADIAHGASQAFTWIYTAIGMGQVGFKASYAGVAGVLRLQGSAAASAAIEPPDSLPVGAVQIGMQATTGSADQVYINPRRGDKYSFAMRPSGAGTVTVKVYNARGVKVWETSQSVSGSQQVSVPAGGWPGRDSSGDFLPSGAYYAIVTGPGLKFKTWIAIVN